MDPQSLVNILPAWNLEQRLQVYHAEHERLEKEKALAQALQAQNFEQNVNAFAQEITHSLALWIFEQIATVLKETKRAIPSKDVPYKMTCSFHRFSEFSHLARENIQLSPFNDWKNRIYHCNDKERTSYFKRIRDMTFVALNERMKEFKDRPANHSAVLNLSTGDDYGSTVGKIEASFWLDLKKMPLAPVVREEEMPLRQELDPSLTLSKSAFPSWTISQLLQERAKLNQKRLEKQKEQEANFEQNFTAVARAIALSVAKEFFKKIDQALEETKSILPSSKDPLTLRRVFIHDEGGRGNSHPFYEQLDDVTLELTPFKDWSKEIHYYSDDQKPQHILQSKIVKVRDESIKELKLILQQYLSRPGNTDALFGTKPHDNQWTDLLYGECALSVAFWVGQPPPEEKNLVDRIKEWYVSCEF